MTYSKNNRYPYTYSPIPAIDLTGAQDAARASGSVYQPLLTANATNIPMPGLSTDPAKPRGFWNSALGLDGEQGWLQPTLGAVQGIGNLYLGMQNYNMAKDALAMNKERFERNWAAQRQTTNARLEDRQRARYASNPSFYEAPDKYMSRYGVA